MPRYGAANRTAADAFATNVLPVVRQIQAAGVATHRAIAEALNARGIRTARGGAWYSSTVRNLLAWEVGDDAGGNAKLAPHHQREAIKRRDPG
jgi:alkylated DNA nucleotide flippase Atl1